ncbi:MAG: hypothetical protein CM1200mP41_30290 [Gammaproteobacteria bacterium]|nr:MAG: hypothetical protein CM1200mP41_30290 [Gammaproteobacteria bacterium]
MGCDPSWGEGSGFPTIKAVDPVGKDIYWVGAPGAELELARELISMRLRVGACPLLRSRRI